MADQTTNSNANEYTSLVSQRRSPSPRGRDDSPLVFFDEGYRHNKYILEGGLSVVIEDVSLRRRIKQTIAAFLTIFLMAIIASIIYVAIRESSSYSASSITLWKSFQKFFITTLPFNNNDNKMDEIDDNIDIDNIEHKTVSNQLITYLSSNSLDTTSSSYKSITLPISDDCVFKILSTDNSEFGENEEDVLRNLLISTNEFIISYEISDINRDDYHVEYIYGSQFGKVGSDINNFAIIIKINKDTNDIYQVDVMSSEYPEPSAPHLYSRLFNTFDFNNNEKLELTEYAAMMNALSGLGSIETFNELNMLSYISNAPISNRHIKFTESQFMKMMVTDTSTQNVKSFGKLRHLVRNGIIEGYMAYINDNKCLYYTLSWNCIEVSGFYESDNKTNAVYRVSNLMFASVCCSL